MSKYNTGNPLGSTAAKDLYDNAQNLDHLSADQVNENWNDRLGKSRKTWFGMEQDHARQLISQENRFQDFLLDSGYEFLGLYVNGPLTFTARNQFTLFDNQYYRLNKNTAVGFKTTGIDAASFTNDVNHFVLMDGDTIRQDLASTTLDDMGDAMVGVLQPFTGAVARTQHDKNQDLTSYADYNGSRSAFDPYAIDDVARATAAAQKTPYAGMSQFVIPYVGLKVWKFLDGPRDRGAVVSISNIEAPSDGEPVTQVANYANAQGTAVYQDRDSVGLNINNTAQPALVTDSVTTFTSTTVTAPNIGTSSPVIKKGQVIDVKDTSAGVVYSSYVLGIAGTTITIDTAWYVRDGTGNITGTPTAGSLMIIAGFTKAWGQNTNVTVNADSFATGMAGYELGLVNNKTDGLGYGFDCVNLGSKKIGNFFQARGTGTIGLASYVGKAFGCVSFSATTAGFYSSGDNVGFSGQGNAIGVEIKAPTTYALQVVKNDNTFMTGINPIGAWQRLRLDSSSITSGGTMSSFTPFNTITPASDGANFTMPAASGLGQVLVYVRNLHATFSVTAVGSFEGGAGTFTIPAKTTKQFWSDGLYWYPAN